MEAGDPVKALHKAYTPRRPGHLLSVREGEIHSLLGPNGAGKSNTISMISRPLSLTMGRCSMGHLVAESHRSRRRWRGAQDVAIYPDLSARENLYFWGKM